MRSKMSDRENDPSSSRSYDRDPTEDLEDELTEMEEYATNFFDEENIDSDIQSQEFSALNQQLDQLQSALDMLESRNADIHEELLQLLQSNREVRRCLTEEMASGAAGVAIENNASSTGVTENDSTTNVDTLPISESGATENSLVQSIETIKLEKCGGAN